jgi:hypothetical protein
MWVLLDLTEVQDWLELLDYQGRKDQLDLLDL